MTQARAALTISQHVRVLKCHTAPKTETTVTVIKKANVILKHSVTLDTVTSSVPQFPSW